MTTAIDRRCTSCGDEKPETAFYWVDKAKTRRRGECKGCHADKARARVAKDPSIKAARDKAYRAANLEKVKVTKRAYYLAHRNEIITRTQRYRESDREHWLEYYRNYNRENATQRQAWRRANYDSVKNSESCKQWAAKYPERKRLNDAVCYHRRREAEGAFTPADITLLKAIQSGRCHWCFKPLGDAYHIDHRVPLIKGGTNDPRNLVLAHPFCNLSKHAKMPWEFMEGRLL